MCQQMEQFDSSGEENSSSEKLLKVVSKTSNMSTMICNHEMVKVTIILTSVLTFWHTLYV